MQSPRNARFWFYSNAGPVKITLKPEQTLSHHAAWNTDEGWSSVDEEWYYDGEYVFQTTYSDGCDCDGRLGSFNKSKCHVDNLRGREPYTHGDAELYAGIMLPMWESVDRYQRDYAAEAAGY